MALAQRGRQRSQVSGVRLAQLRQLLEDGDQWVTTRTAAEIVRAAQAEPTVSRQLVSLWAQRHGVKGRDWSQEAFPWATRQGEIHVSLAWLVSFLERTGRGVEGGLEGGAGGR